MTRQNKKNVPREEFIEVWNAAKNVREVMVRTNLLYTTVVGRAFQLRKQGYDLQRFSNNCTKSKQPASQGVIGWLRENHPEVYREWKEIERSDSI